MKRLGPNQAAAVILTTAILLATTLKLFQYHMHSRTDPSPVHDRPVVETPAAIPPAPPPLASSKRRPVANLPMVPTQVPITGLSLSYDESLTFGANLVRLKEFWSSHSNDQRLQQVLD